VTGVQTCALPISQTPNPKPQTPNPKPLGILIKQLKLSPILKEPLKLKTDQLITRFDFTMDKNPNAKNEGHITERALGNTWCLWEKYQEAYVQNATNYDKNMFIIYTFNSLEDFALLWKHTTYSTPSKLFYDLTYETTKKLINTDGDTEEKIVDGLFIFKQGIEPKWEDPANQRGCTIWLELLNLNAISINKFWKDVVFAIIGQNFPFSDYVNGFRILDRMKKHRSIKFELWLACGVGGLKVGSEEYTRNNKIINEIIDYTYMLVNRIQEISIHQITKKEHLVANKVN